MGQCGTTPKLIAFGVAPLGIVSIGIVPMGVVSIGVVPMGVISLGVVGMGVLNATVVGMGVLIAGVNVMGVWWLGMEGMGPFRLGPHPEHIRAHHSHGSVPPAADGNSRNVLAYPSRAVAEQKARELGCSGAHRMGSLWMPCAHHLEH